MDLASSHITPPPPRQYPSTCSVRAVRLCAARANPPCLRLSVTAANAGRLKEQALCSAFWMGGGLELKRRPPARPSERLVVYSRRPKINLTDAHARGRLPCRDALRSNISQLKHLSFCSLKSGEKRRWWGFGDGGVAAKTHDACCYCAFAALLYRALKTPTNAAAPS